jgi:opacity protein-like surface antigen
MKAVSIRVALASVFALLPALAFAQTHDELSGNHLVSIGLGGGVTVPVSDAKDAFKNGFNGQGFVRLNLHFLPVSPRLDFTFSKFDLDDAKVGTTGTGQVLAGLANLQMYLIHGGPIRPYIVAGVGAYNVKTEIDASGAASEQEISDTRFGVNGGAGLVIKLPVVSLYAEGRVDNVFTDKGLIDSDQIQVVPVSFGLVY